MIEVTVNGVSLASLGLGVKRVDIPVLPDTRENSVELSVKDGEVDFGANYATRIFNIECILMANDATTDYHQKVSVISALFNVKKGDMEFTFSSRPGLIFMARYAGTMPIEKIIFDGYVSIPIKMHDPYPASSEQISETTVTSSPETITIVSGGDVEAYPIITIKNTGLNTIVGFTIRNQYEVN